MLTFKIGNMKKLTEDKFSLITMEEWVSVCNHVKLIWKIYAENENVSVNIFRNLDEDLDTTRSSYSGITHLQALHNKLINTPNTLIASLVTWRVKPYGMPVPIPSSPVLQMSIKCTETSNRDITLCSPLKVELTADCKQLWLLPALLFNPEDEGACSHEASVDFQWTLYPRRHISS
jgi:hypothetical protein